MPLQHCTCEVTYWYGSVASQPALRSSRADHHQLHACCTPLSLSSSLRSSLLLLLALPPAVKLKNSTRSKTTSTASADMRVRCDVCVLQCLLLISLPVCKSTEAIYTQQIASSSAVLTEKIKIYGGREHEQQLCPSKVLSIDPELDHRSFITLAGQLAMNNVGSLLHK